jgi:hypothetical protein
VFVVYPADEARGLIRLEGRWTGAAELERGVRTLDGAPEGAEAPALPVPERE